MYTTFLSSTCSYSLLLSRAAKILGILAVSTTLLSSSHLASGQPNVIQNITQPTERLEMTVNTSRILTLERRIPRIVVNNPELVSATPISANQVQLAALKPGVTQINLWDEEGQVFSVDIMIFGDVRELEQALVRLFPESSVKVMRLTNSLVLEGFVERPEAVGPILRLAEDYAPKIVNNITVGGVQQVLLKVKVMEVSRTKLRTLGVDWAYLDGGGSIVASSIAGLITDTTTSGGTGLVESVGSGGGQTFEFGVVGANDSFFAFLEALQANNMAKILADPTITAVSGRPAHFNVGGELPIIVPSGLGQTSVEFKKFGTQVDFLPIVLGNGNIRLEVRPRVSEIDDTRSVQVGAFQVPALKVREVDTGVELKAGQTLALAGLVQTRIDASERGLPFFGDLPYVGAAFRRVTEEVNEIELLIMVTPEFVDGMDPHEVPTCGPGMESVSPTNCQLYFGGHLEMPATGQCAPYPYAPGCQTGGASYPAANYQPAASVIDIPREGAVSSPPQQSSQAELPAGSTSNEDLQALPSTTNQPPPRTGNVLSARNAPPKQQPANPVLQPAGSVQREVARKPQSAAVERQPAWQASQTRRQMPTEFSREPTPQQSPRRPVTAQTTTPGLIGPIGYDVEK